jgi:hypothetical protein
MTGVAWQASAGAAVISGESWTEFLSTKGFFVPEEWDVYWANRRVRTLLHDTVSRICIFLKARTLMRNLYCVAGMLEGAASHPVRPEG